MEKPTILSAKNLVKSFRMGDTTVNVLKQLELDVLDGEFIAIEGRSGTGKSTLLHILAGLDASDSGKIEASGVAIGDLASAVDRRRKWLKGNFLFRLPFLGPILDAFLVLTTSGADRKLSKIRNEQFGFVFQFYYLLPELNVLENVMLAPMIEHSYGGYRSTYANHRARATELLRQFGLDNRLKQKVTHLSGGERQRVAIARALMNKPKILFADEPTGNLDAETGWQIMSVLEQLHRDQGQTIVMVTHDRSIARHADRVLVLDEGKLKEAVP